MSILEDIMRDDRKRLIERLAPGYVECDYADAERGTDDGARKAISKEGLNGTIEVGLFLPDRPGVKYGPAIWLCRAQVARDLKTLRGTKPGEDRSCPFCGGTEFGSISNERPQIVKVHCLSCGTTGPNAELLDEAQKLWNQRKDPT